MGNKEPWSRTKDCRRSQAGRPQLSVAKNSTDIFISYVKYIIYGVSKTSGTHTKTSPEFAFYLPATCSDDIFGPFFRDIPSYLLFALWLSLRQKKCIHSY